MTPLLDRAAQLLRLRPKVPETRRERIIRSIDWNCSWAGVVLPPDRYEALVRLLLAHDPSEDKFNRKRLRITLQELSTGRPPSAFSF